MAEQVTVIGSASALDALLIRLAGDAVEANRDQPRLEGYGQAGLGSEERLPRFANPSSNLRHPSRRRSRSR